MKRFYVRRAFRILPPMLVYVAVILLLAAVRAIPAISWREITAVLFFFRNYTDGSWYTGHFWSLAVEEQFYAVIPVFLLVMNRSWAVRWALTLIALCIGVRWFEYAHGLAATSLIQFHTENRIDGLLWGAILALVLQDVKLRQWFRANVNGFLLAVILLVSFAILIRFDSQPVRRTVVAMTLPFLLGYTVLNAESLLGRFLELSSLKWIGRMSYSLYIWQMMFLPEGDRPLGVIQAFPLNLICPLLCAMLSFYVIEKPMIKLGHRLAGVAGSALHGRPE